MKYSISMRQAGIIALFIIFSNKILLLPGLMHEYIKADAVFAVILLFALEFLTIPIFLKFKRNFPKEKLYDILKHYLTAIGAKLIYLAAIVFMIFKALLTFSVVYVYFKEQIYQEEFIWIALIAFLPIMNHSVMSGLRPTARTMELFFSIILTGFIFCLVISFFTPISTPFFFVSSAKDIFFSLYKYAFTFGDFIFLFLIIDKIDYKKAQEKKIYFYVSLGMFLVITLFFLFYCKYHLTSFMHNNALADLLVFSVQFNAIGRLDIVAMLTIMMVTLFQMELFCFGFCECFVNIFPLNKLYGVVFFDIIFLILYYIFIGKYEIMVKSTVTWLPVLGLVVGVLFPIICLICTMIKRRKNEKTD